MEKAARLVNGRPGVDDHASHADQAPNNRTPVPKQLDAFDADGQIISADLIRYSDVADRVLVRDKAERALAAAVSIDQVKAIHDLAVGMLAYAKTANDRDLEADAAEIRMKATRRLGEMMKAQKETVGLNEGGRPTKTGLPKNPVSELPTLGDVGIDKNLAHLARTAASMSEPEFGQAVEAKRATVGKKKLKVRSPASQENAFDICVDDVRRLLLKALRRLEQGRCRRLRTSLHDLIDEVFDSEIESKAAAKATTKPKAKPKSKSKRKKVAPASDAESAA
jgi:hypothetical protein